TRLYRDLAEREAKIRRLVDANIIGIGIWNSKGQILDANDAYLRTVGYDREDLLSGRLSWMDLTPPEWAGRTAQTVQELRITGMAQPFEKEYIRKDGSRVPLLIGSAIFDESEEQGFSFVLDLTERKQAEAALREMQMQQVMLNLILNAVEAMSELGEGSRELLITTGKTESGDMAVAVCDTGPGPA